MKRPVVAFDIDGVVADIFPSICFIMKKRYNVIHSPNLQTRFSFEEATGLNEKETRICVDTAIINYLSYKPYYLAIPFLKRYYAFSKKPLQFITSRDSREEIARATYDWLHLYLKDIPFSVSYTKDKVETCINREIEIFIEDRAKVATTLACKGISVILMDRPWNRHVPEDMWNLVRFNDWIEIGKWLDIEDIKLIEHKENLNDT